VENRRRKFRGVEKPENWREAGRPIFRAGAHQGRRRIGAGGRLKLVLIILEEDPFQSAPLARGRPRTSLAKAHREIAVSIRAPGAGATRISPAKAHREIAVSIRAPGAGATRTSLAKAHRKIAVSIRAPGAGATRPSLAKAHHEIAVSIGAPRAGGAGYQLQRVWHGLCASRKSSFPVIGRRDYIMSKPDDAIEPGARG
jgi:hypothetical protein